MQLNRTSPGTLIKKVTKICNLILKLENQEVKNRLTYLLDEICLAVRDKR